LGKIEVAHLLEGLSLNFRSFKVLRKVALIFSGAVISFLLANQVGSAKPLVAVPSSLSFTIPEEGVDTCYEEKDYKAWIAVQYEDSYLKIRAFCFNNTSKDEVLKYKLEVRKSGRSGVARSFQGGSVHIPGQEKKCLSKPVLSVFPKDHYRIKLEVYKDGELIAEDSIFYPPIRVLREEASNLGKKKESAKMG
jgi:hypothetical protein